MYLVAPVQFPLGTTGSAGTSITSPPTRDTSALSVISAITGVSATDSAATTRAAQTRQPNEGPDPEFSMLNLRSGLGPLLRTNRVLATTLVKSSV